jgi:hypothetical protein
VLMTEDTKSPVPYRYQQYGITVKLTPDKHDKTRSTFGTLPKTYPTLWVCCAHHGCMAVYDVSSANDTQRNIHLTDHHTLGAKTGNSHQDYRIFWKSGPELKTALLAVTSYAPPKVEDKAASEWLLEYVLAVLQWYGVEPIPLDCLPRKRAKTEPRYFQSQLIGNVNYPWMPEAHEMPVEAMTRAVVHQNLPEAGFGVP